MVKRRTRTKMAERGIAKRRTIGRPGLLLGLVTAAALAFAGMSGSAAAQSGEGLSMEEVVEIVNAKGLGTVYEVESERDGFEVKVQDAEGVRLKLFVDSVTGEILHEKRVDDDDQDEEDD